MLCFPGIIARTSPSISYSAIAIASELLCGPVITAEDILLLFLKIMVQIIIDIIILFYL